MADEPTDGNGAVAARLRDVAVSEKEEYEGDRDRPVGSFLALMATYAAAVAALGVVVRRRRAALPERVDLRDLTLAVVATHKLSRLVAKDVVTSGLRAPFTRFAGTAGPGELQEKVRGTGLRKAVGALVTCPFCVGLWVATAFGFGLVLAPRATRLAALVLALAAGSDVLQFAYTTLEEKSAG